MCVLQLKEKVAVKFNVQLEQICSIHSGKILYGAEDLSGRGIVDDAVVHMVVKSAGAQVCTIPMVMAVILYTNLWFLPLKAMHNNNNDM